MLLYTLDLGKSEQTIARQAYMSREPLPDRIKNAPRLFMGLQLYLQAFFDLDSERKHDFGLAPIPRHVIVHYGLELELDDEQREDLLHHVRAMDRAHLNRLEERRKTDGK